MCMFLYMMYVYVSIHDVCVCFYTRTHPPAVKTFLLVLEVGHYIAGVHRIHRVHCVHRIHRVHCVHCVHCVHRFHRVHRVHCVHCIHCVHRIHRIHRVHRVHCVHCVHPVSTNVFQMTREMMEQHMAENSQHHLLILSQAVNQLFKVMRVPLQFHDLSGTTDPLPLVNIDSLNPEVGIALATRPGDTVNNDDVRLALQKLNLPSAATPQIMSGLSSLCQSDNFLRTLNRPGVLSSGASSVETLHSEQCCFEADTAQPQFGSDLLSTTSLLSDQEFQEELKKKTQYNAIMEARVEKLERLVEEQGARLKYYKQCVESRFCNGTYVWKIKDFFRLRNEATQGRITALHSTGFYCSVYGYKICIRINLNGVESGFATHISLFVHFMKGEYDDILEWPFRGRITLSILDQNDNYEKRRDIMETLEANPELAAFQRPTTSRNHKGFGYIEFASIPQIESSTYIKNDALFVKASILSK